jgi:hypothetical protein
VRACVLLGVYCGLGEGEAGVSDLLAGVCGAACAAAEGVGWGALSCLVLSTRRGDGGEGCDDWDDWDDYAG